MSKILELAEEIDKQFYEQDQQIKVLRGRVGHLESELNNEKERTAKLRKGLITLLSEYLDDDLCGW